MAVNSWTVSPGHGDTAVLSFSLCGHPSVIQYSVKGEFLSYLRSKSGNPAAAFWREIEMEANENKHEYDLLATIAIAARFEHLRKRRESAQKALTPPHTCPGSLSMKHVRFAHAPAVRVRTVVQRS